MSLDSLATGVAAAQSAIEYNGFRFPAGALTEDFTCTPVKDSSGRTIVHSEFRIRVSAYLSLDLAVPADVLTQTAVELLTQPACSFKYLGRGIGNVTINLGGSSDVVWGPFPVILTLKPYHNQTVKIVWEVTFAIPTCNDARYTGPAEFNYTTSISIDKGGISTRVYSGFIRIAQNRINPRNHTVATSADVWREKINPPLITGFRRIPGDFRISEDKCRLDFTIRDEEIPGENIPPRDVVEASAEHSYTSEAGKLTAWVGSLGATYEIPKLDGLGLNSAIQSFLGLATDRLSLLRDLTKSKQGIGIIPVTFHIADVSIYAQMRVRIEMKYRVVGTLLSVILNSGGLWRPVPDSDWDLWSTSIKANIGPRGVAGLKSYYPGEEQIVDLCARIPQDKPTKSQNPNPNRPARGTRKPGGRFVPSNLPSVFPPAPVDPFAPKPGASWLGYNAMIRFETDSGTVAAVTLPDSPLVTDDTLPTFNAMAVLPDATTSPSLVGADGHVTPSRGDPGGAFSQQRTVPMTFIFLEGWAIRAGYEIPPPELVSVGDVDLIPANRLDCGEGFQQSIIGQGGVYGSIPIYAASWRYRYLLPKLPSQPVVPLTPPNPLLDPSAAFAGGIINTVQSTIFAATANSLIGGSTGGLLGGGGLLGNLPQQQSLPLADLGGGGV